MKYLISGSTGFIGSNLCSALLNDGEEVRSIPRDYLYNYFELKNYLEMMNPDYIIHLAAWGNHSTQKDLDKTVSANIGVTTTMLQASRDVGYRSFINISSSSVSLPTETFYSATKAGAERICKAFSREHGKPIVNIRPYSVYGIGEASFRFIPTVIKSAKSEESFNLVPNSKHDWIYIKDFINGLKLVIPHSEKMSGESINIGTGRDYTNKDVVDIIEKIHGKKLNYKLVDNLRDYDCDSWVADTQVLEYMGWTQEHSLEQGLRETYEYY